MFSYVTNKRVFDIVTSLISIIILFPLFLITYILIKIDSPFDTAFYLGERVSINNSRFKLFKFRSMIINAEKVGGFSTAKNDFRLTKVGRFLRKFKLDELHQLFNVLLGDMAMIGPRPQVPFYVDKYNSKQKKIISVKPGITDIASLIFNDMDDLLGDHDPDLVYSENIEPKKNKLRVEYVEKMSLFLDLCIFFATVLYFFRVPLSYIKKFLVKTNKNLDLEI